MFWRLSHIVAYISASFLLKTELYSCVNRPYLLIHSSVIKYLACLHPLPIVNNAATNICVQVFVWISIFILLGINPGVELRDHRAALRWSDWMRGSCTLRHRHQWWVSTPTSPCPHQECLLPSSSPQVRLLSGTGLSQAPPGRSPALECGQRHVEGPGSSAHCVFVRLWPGGESGKPHWHTVPSTWAPGGSRHTNGPGTLETVPENTCGSDQACPAQHPVCAQLIITDKVSSLPISGSTHFSRLLNLIGKLGLTGLSLGPCHKPQQLCFVVKCLRCVEIASPSGPWIPQC